MYKGAGLLANSPLYYAMFDGVVCILYLFSYSCPGDTVSVLKHRNREHKQSNLISMFPPIITVTRKSEGKGFPFSRAPNKLITDRFPDSIARAQWGREKRDQLIYGGRENICVRCLLFGICSRYTRRQAAASVRFIMVLYLALR